MQEINDKSWMAFVSSIEVYQSLETFALSKGIESSVIKKCSIQEALYLINEAEIFLLEYVPNKELDLAYKLFTQRAHDRGSKVVLLSTKKNMPEFNWLTSIGIDSVDTIPIEIERLNKVFNNLFKNNNSTNSDCAKIISFIKFKPNNGSITCALNTAAILSKKQKTLIIDFDIYFSPSSTFFDFEENNYLEELLEKPERIDSQLILSSVMKISKNLFILSSTINLEKKANYSNKAIDKLIVNCSYLYSYIIIYLPFSQNVHKHPSLILSDFLIGIVNLDKANKKAIQNMMPLLLKANNSNNIHICVNQPCKSTDFTIETFFKDLSIKPSGKIGYHESLMTESRKQKILAASLDYNSKFSYELSDLLMNIGLLNKSADFIFLRKIKDFIKNLKEKLNEK